MAKKNKTQPRSQRPPKKSLVSKKAEIEKLIEASKEKSFSETKSRTPSPSERTANVRLPPCQPRILPTRAFTTRQNLHCIHPTYAISRVQGSTQDKFFVRSEPCRKAPVNPTVRLPQEPSTSRALRHYKREGRFPFLDLPGELRNKIYDYAITKEHYAIEWVGNTQKSKSLTYRLPRPTGAHPPKLEPGAAQRRRLLDYHHRRVHATHLAEDDVHPGPTVLLFVCKSMSDEAASVLYSKCMFHFHGLRALRHFLDNLRPLTTKSITRLALTYDAYGHPVKTEDQRWKEKHDRLWEQLCWRVADNCPLIQLSLKLKLPRSPTFFCAFDKVRATDIATRWIMPLWAFQDAGIQRCWGQIQCHSKSRSELQKESLRMRKEIVGEMWDGEAESTRDDYGYDRGTRGGRDVKKGMVLRLRVDGGLELS